MNRNAGNPAQTKPTARRGHRCIRDWQVDGSGAPVPYVNFFGTPSDADRYHGDPPDGVDIVKILENLARQMYGDRPRVPSGNGDRLRNNADIPAGYTYFGQLLAHDLTFNRLPLSAARRGLSDLENLRDQPLLLQCIYGRGPQRSPALYEIRKDPSDPRIKLRLGTTYHPGRDRRPTYCFADLPRARTDVLSDEKRKSLRYEPLIADERNEDNLILSQLVVLFHRLHNLLIDRLAARHPPEAASGPVERWRQDTERFDLARRLTLTCYRAIIERDYLCRLLDPDVYTRYAARPREHFRPELFGAGGFRIPLEFSMAAFRFGHAMVRGDYDFNATHAEGGDNVALLVNVLAAAGAEGELHAPLTEDWRIDWRRFFGTSTEKNGSRLLSPGFASALREQIQTPLAGGIAQMDLQRGLSHPIHSVASLLEKFRIARSFPNYALSDPSRRATAIRRRLGSSTVVRLSDDQAEILSADPPLFYYVLFEAEHQHGGRRLGTLGSILVAEVIFGALRCTGAAVPPPPDSLVQSVFDGPMPCTMVELIDLPGLIAPMPARGPE